MDLTDRSELIKYLKQNKLWAKKSLGQNFLVDLRVLDKIIAAAELKKSDTVLEIGPGMGILTTELIKKVNRVIAIEKDDKLADKLKLITQNSKLITIEGDVLDLDLVKLMKLVKLKANKASYKLVANIPYYITSRVLKKFLTKKNKPELIVLLTQKEVAERVCAKPGEMSVMSVAVQFYGEPEIVEIVKSRSFFPQPKVDSAIIKIKIKNDPSRLKGEAEAGKLKIKEADLFKIVRAGFHARRKTLINNLAVGTNLSREQLFDILKRMELDKNVRAQELSVEQWIELTKLILSKI